MILQQKRWYAASGALLGLGAPLGLVALRWLERRCPRGIGWLRAELAADPSLYAYATVATTIAFGAFGFALGRKQERLVAAHAKLDRLHEEHTSIVAHDLRSPIQALSLQAELLLKNREDGEVRVAVPAVERMTRATKALAAMVDDLLDASRIESGQLRIEPRPTDVGGATAELVEQLRPTLGQHPVEVVVAADVPLIAIDPKRLDRIVTNLLENAGKYSDPTGAIRVAVERSGDGAVIRIEDHGPGIAPEELPRLFERFYQTVRARAKRSGLGLGLYITKGLVEAHGGRVGVESTPGVGSTFRVWLPAVRM
jgi:signal transduction histidine kinase